MPSWVEFRRYEFDLASVALVERAEAGEGHDAVAIYLDCGKEVRLSGAEARSFRRLFADFKQAETTWGGGEGEPPAVLEVRPKSGLSPGQPVGVEEGGVGVGDGAPDEERTNAAHRNAPPGRAQRTT